MEYIIYIGAALVIGLLIGFTSLSVIWFRKAMLRNVRSHTLDLLSLYDSLLEEKSYELSGIEKKLGESVESEETLAKHDLASRGETHGGVSPAVVLAVADRALETSYRDPVLGDSYRLIRENFSFQMEEIIPLLDKNSEENGCGPAGKLLSELSYDTVYALSTLDENVQLSVLWDSLSEDGKAILQAYRENHPSFSVFGFYDHIISLSEEEPRSPRLYVPSGTMVRAGDSRYVEIRADKDICEGFQIEMGGKLYDYCIKNKELS